MFAIGAAMVVVGPTAAAAQTFYAIKAPKRLITVDLRLNSPPLTPDDQVLTGLQTSEALLDLDIRPKTGELYTVTDQGRVYIIDHFSGSVREVTLQSALPNPITQASVDFDAVNDRLRVIIGPTSGTQANYGINVDTGVVTQQTDLASPVDGLAYVSNAIDATDVRAVSLTLGSGVGNLRLMTDPSTGASAPLSTATTTGAFAVSAFDIAGADSTRGYAIVSDSGTDTIVLIDLAAGGAPRSVFALPNALTGLRGLAVASFPATLWGLDRDNRLHQFTSSRPQQILRTLDVTGLQANEKLIAADFASNTEKPDTPVDDTFFGVTDQNRLYRISPDTGVATQLGTGTFALPIGAPIAGMTALPYLAGALVSTATQTLLINTFTGAVVDGDPFTDGLQPWPHPGGVFAEVSGLAFPFVPDSFPAIGSDLGGWVIDVPNTSLRVFSGATASAPVPMNTPALVNDGSVGFDTSPDGPTMYAALRTVASGTRLFAFNTRDETLIEIGPIGDGTTPFIALAAETAGRPQAQSVSVSEGAGVAQVTFTRPARHLHEPRTYLYQLIDNGATAGQDYVAATGLLQFAAGQATGTLPITIHDDAIVEGAMESIRVLMRRTTRPAVGGEYINMGVSITDNDVAPVPPTVTITAPTTDATLTTQAETIALGGTAADDQSIASVTWSHQPSGTSGTATGTTAWTLPSIALSLGVNTIVVTATDNQGLTATDTLTVTREAVPPTPLIYLLAEGSTGGFFETKVLLANPNTTAAPVTVRYLPEAGSPVMQTFTLAGLSRKTIDASTVTGLVAGAFATEVTSTDGLPIVVERTMTWDVQTRYGAHTDKAVEGPAPVWYFAEGAQGFFQSYFLLVNPRNEPIGATLEFLRDGEAPVTATYTVPAAARLTVDASTVPGLSGRSFGTVVTFTQPGVAERAMYFGSSPLFNGGHGAAGVTTPSTDWLLAEGATGPFFDTFVLLANPGDADATATVTFLPASGPSVQRFKTVPARSRVTINIEIEDASLANVPVATFVTATRPIVVERAMYWPGGGLEWYEAHASFGVTAAGTKWGLAEGRIGGTDHAQTYILLANALNAPATVTITYLREQGAPIVRQYTVAAASRFNVHVNSMVPELADESFGALVTSDQPIAVERALYTDANGVTWAAGTNATAARLP